VHFFNQIGRHTQPPNKKQCRCQETVQSGMHKIVLSIFLLYTYANASENLSPRRLGESQQVSNKW
jgi:hypothetical protein